MLGSDGREAHVVGAPEAQPSIDTAYAVVVRAELAGGRDDAHIRLGIEVVTDPTD